MNLQFSSCNAAVQEPLSFLWDHWHQAQGNHFSDNFLLVLLSLLQLFEAVLHGRQHNNYISSFVDKVPLKKRNLNCGGTGG
jgi:hypothetical protein